MTNRTPTLAFYGDDFTGSTDALETLTLAGARTALFLDPPAPEQLNQFPNLDAIGVAGFTRSLSTDQLSDVLVPAFRALKATGAPIVHYKVCSTFDSSPTIGSIGKAIDIGFDVFAPTFVPVIVGAPALGRHCVFGNLFARFGTTHRSPIHRLDRHPSMAKHPVTPANEADLTLHLAAQTDRSIALLDILTLRDSVDVITQRLRSILDEKNDIVLFDLLDEEQLPKIGAALDQQCLPEKTLFTVGSSAVGASLGAHWNETNRFTLKKKWQPAPLTGPALVLSGSASPVTESQITAGIQAGFMDVPIDTAAVFKGSGMDLAPILRALGSGRSVIVHTCRGPNDPRLAQHRGSNRNTAKILGHLLGTIAQAAIEERLTRRILFAGGDTSSHAARALGLTVLEMIAPVVPGAPLCRASSDLPSIDGIQVNFKGGQVGAPDYFTTATT